MYISPSTPTLSCPNVPSIPFLLRAASIYLPPHIHSLPLFFAFVIAVEHYIFMHEAWCPPFADDALVPPIVSPSVLQKEWGLALRVQMMRG